MQYQLSKVFSAFLSFLLCLNSNCILGIVFVVYFLNNYYYYNHTKRLCCVKDAMPVSFRSQLLTSYILTIFKQRNLLR